MASGHLRDLRKQAPSSMQWAWPGSDPLYPVVTTCLSLTTTAPVGLERQVDREAASFASIMKYSSHEGLFWFIREALRHVIG